MKKKINIWRFEKEIKKSRRRSFFPYLDKNHIDEFLLAPFKKLFFFLFICWSCCSAAGRPPLVVHGCIQSYTHSTAHSRPNSWVSELLAFFLDSSRLFKVAIRCREKREQLQSSKVSQTIAKRKSLGVYLV